MVGKSKHGIIVYVTWNSSVKIERKKKRLKKKKVYVYHCTSVTARRVQGCPQGLSSFFFFFFWVPFQVPKVHNDL